MSETHEQAIVRGVLEAIAEHRLKAGTKLGESDLCAIYSCNRSHVRHALASLATQNVVEIKPNRGAFVAVPTPAQAHNVFQARRAIEATIVRSVVRQASAAQIASLRAHTRREKKARGSHSPHTAIRLSGGFHQILGEICGNDVLAGFLNELVARTSLIIGLYAASPAPLCGDQEHSAIVDVIERRDEEAVVTLMDEHLHRLEGGIRFEPAQASSDLRAILGAVRSDRD